MTHDHNKTIPEYYAQLVEYSIRTGEEVNLSTSRSLQMGQCAMTLAELDNGHKTEAIMTALIADDEQPGLSRAVGFTLGGDHIEMIIDNNSGTVVTEIKHDSTGDFGDDSLIPPED